MMHPGVKKQAIVMQRWFGIDEIGLYTVIKQVKKGCSVCQACNPDNRNVRGEGQWTPIPDQPMESVAMEVFSMPEVHIGKEVFDCVVLCVDRQSGYVVAVPACKKGLLANQVAVMMIRGWLAVFGVRRTICSDRGPQFTGGWFKVMCSLMGIWHAKGVAYLSRSNDGAEVAGRQLFEKLRRIHLTNKRRNWFEEMWLALKAHHDTPTSVGLSPHQILFCRVGDSFCQVKAWQWMPRSSWSGKRPRHGRLVSRPRKSAPCEPRPPRSLHGTSSGWVTRCGY